VALCADRPGAKSAERDKQAPTLGARLLAGDRFGFLRELDLPSDGAIRVWKVVPTR
jgi:hypothetical protein